MCGRYALNEKTDDVAKLTLSANTFEDWAPSFSISPTQVVPIVREREHDGTLERTVDAAVWNFRPEWMKESKRPQFNSRIETVAANGLWKGAFAKTRCLVPMAGYFEWTEREKLKIPHFIHGDGLLTAAGIYTARQEDDEWILSCSIITREARDASGELHDRMPAFLTPDVFDQWVSPEPLEDQAQKEEMLAMLTAVSEDVAKTITTYEVDRKVNNSRAVDRSDASLIAPV